MVNAIINGKPLSVPEGTTILEAARQVQVAIPTLCKHPDLPPTAACGVCVVKVAGSDRMLRACCTPIEEGMQLITHDPEIIDVRRTVIELILSNHPSTCLTCGRNNTCELQRLASDFGIREDPYERIIEAVAPDRSTGAIVIEPDKCIHCGRCMEICQDLQDVWALSFLGRGFKARFAPVAGMPLDDSPCVICGQCSAHCPTGAIFELDDTRKVWDQLQSPEHYCVAQVAPSVRVALGEAFGCAPGTNLTGKIYTVLRRLGFQAVFDTNFGADVTVMEEAAEFIRRFVHGSGPLPLITTCCPSWVNYLETRAHDMIAHFSSCKSPHQILGALAKTYFARQAGVDPTKITMVSIMPCTSKKREISRTREMAASGYQDVDHVLTTREFARMIKQTGKDLLALPDGEPTHVMGDYSGAATIFGTTGGVMEAALRTASYMLTGANPPDSAFRPLRGLSGIKTQELTIAGRTLRVAAAHGLGNVETVLEQLRQARHAGEPPPYDFIEVMACPGGCVGGGGQIYGVTNEIRAARAEGLYRDDEGHTVRCAHDNPAIIALYDGLLEKPGSPVAEQLLHTHY